MNCSSYLSMLTTPYKTQPSNFHCSSFSQDTICNTTGGKGRGPLRAVCIACTPRTRCALPYLKPFIELGACIQLGDHAAVCTAVRMMMVLVLTSMRSTLAALHWHDMVLSGSFIDLMIGLNSIGLQTQRIFSEALIGRHLFLALEAASGGFAQTSSLPAVLSRL